jgi:hypothetical protein
MKILFAMTLALFGWVSTSNHASAATISIDPNPIAFFGDIVGKHKTFSQAYEFSFTGVADGFFGVLSKKIKNLTTNICLNATCSGTDAVVVAGDTHTGPFSLVSLSGNTFTSLAAGTYYLVVTGKTKHWKGGYLGKLALNVSPVPVPGALVLFLTAIGGLGAAGHFRRNKTAA